MANDPEKFAEFEERYREELATGAGRDALRELRDAVHGKRVTLLTDSRDVDHSQATVLAGVLTS